MKKRLISLSLGIVMVLSLTVAASAAWSADTVLDVPGWNGSKTSSNYATKTTEDNQCTFHTYSNEAGGLYGVDGRLLNSNNDPRSSCVRNMDDGSTLHASTTAVKNHYYYAQLSTDLLEPNTITVSFKFSPDFES